MSLPSNQTVAGPTLASERIASLDVLRGFALYGVLLTNAFVSARPLQAALDPPTPDNALTSLWSETLGWGLFEGLLVMKFVALFSLLFGMGLVLQSQRAESKGIDFQRVYMRRLGILAAMGLLHGCLLFEGDILLPYALVGGLLFLFRQRPASELASLGLIPFVIGVALSLLWAYANLEGIGEGDAFSQLAQQARREGPLSLLLQTRPIEYFGWLFLSSIISFNWRVVALFFFGAAIMKRGLLGGEHHGLHRRLCLWGLASGLALEGLVILISLSTAEPATAWRLLRAFANEIGSLCLSAGYAGTVLWAVHAKAFARLQRGLAAVGRTALTNYLLQSVAMNLVFMPFALGLYEDLSRLKVLGVFTLVFAAQILGSVFWMRRFAMGPAEWLWRRATYGRPVALARRAPTGG